MEISLQQPGCWSIFRCVGKMRGFYSNLGINTVSLPVMLLKYLLQGTLGKSNTHELYAPEREIYDMLIEAVVGGPSLIIIRKQEVRKAIKSFKYREAQRCPWVLGYDANALYCSTMFQEMPPSKEKVIGQRGCKL